MQILKNEKDYAEVKMEGEDVGFINALKEMLFEDPDVEFAAYRMDHPQVSPPILIVRVRKGNPISAIRTAARRLKREALDFKEALSNSRKVRKK